MARRTLKNGDTVSDRIPEWRLQAEIAGDLDRRIAEGEPFLYAASLEGVRLNPYQAKIAKATGMQDGEPDLRLYFAPRRTVFVELKGDGGSLTPGQKERIPKLRAMGFVVHVVRVKTCEEAKDAIGAIVDAELAGICTSALPSARYWPKARKAA
jgi:hypothetical protein